jgi:hypothetical protein
LFVCLFVVVDDCVVVGVFGSNDDVSGEEDVDPSAAATVFVQRYDRITTTRLLAILLVIL